MYQNQLSLFPGSRLWQLWKLIPLENQVLQSKSTNSTANKKVSLKLATNILAFKYCNSLIITATGESLAEKEHEQAHQQEISEVERGKFSLGI